MKTEIIHAEHKNYDWFACEINRYEQLGYTQGQFQASDKYLIIIMNPPMANWNMSVTGVAQ